MVFCFNFTISYYAVFFFKIDLLWSTFFYAITPNSNSNNFIVYPFLIQQQQQRSMRFINIIFGFLLLYIGSVDTEKWHCGSDQFTKFIFSKASFLLDRASQGLFCAKTNIYLYIYLLHWMLNHITLFKIFLLFPHSKFMSMFYLFFFFW